MTTKFAGQRIEIADLAAALTAAWSRATSADTAGWAAANPAWGQCAVTALAVQDYVGGSLLRGEVEGVSHYWNLLASGDEIDLTRGQFGGGAEIANVEPRSREYVLSQPDTERRYRRLAKRVGREMRTRSLAPTS